MTSTMWSEEDAILMEYILSAPEANMVSSFPKEIAPSSIFMESAISLPFPRISNAVSLSSEKIKIIYLPPSFFRKYDPCEFIDLFYYNFLAFHFDSQNTQYFNSHLLFHWAHFSY